MMRLPCELYHGTCQVFIEYALQKKGRFGPENQEISFTSDLEYATTFANSWRTSQGLLLLKRYFGSSIDEHLETLSEPVILIFNSFKLGKLKKRLDCGTEEYYRKGPIDLELAGFLYI